MNVKERKNIKDLILRQRKKSSVPIKNYYKDIKGLFHPTEFKLISNLVKGFEDALIIEYVVLVHETDSEFPLFDIWALDKVCNIYRGSV